jgi:hypothetical protein
MKNYKVVTIVLILGLIPASSFTKPYDRQNLSELNASLHKLREELKNAKSESERRRIKNDLTTADYWYSYRHYD